MFTNFNVIHLIKIEIHIMYMNSVILCRETLNKKPKSKNINVRSEGGGKDKI